MKDGKQTATYLIPVRADAPHSWPCCSGSLYSAATGADDSTTTTTTQPDDPTRPEASAHSRDDRHNPWSSFRHYPRPRRRHRSSPDYLTGSLHPSSLPPPRSSRNRRDPISPPPPYTQTPESPSSRNPRPLRAATTSWRDRGSNRPPRSQPPRSQPSGSQPPESVGLERSIHRRVYPPRRPSRSLSPRSRSSRHVGQAQAQHDGSPSSFTSAIAAAAAENDDSRRRPFQNAPGATNAYNPPPLPAPPNQQQQQWRSSSPSSTIAPRRAPHPLPRHYPREYSAGPAYTRDLTDFENRRAGPSSSSAAAAAAAGENDGSYDQRMITPSANLYDPAYSRRFTSSNLPLRGRPPPRGGGPSRGGGGPSRGGAGRPPSRRSGEGNSNSDSAYSSDAPDFEVLTFKSPPNRRAGR